MEGAYPRFVMMLMTGPEDAQWITSTLQSALLEVPSPLFHLSFRLAVWHVHALLFIIMPRGVAARGIGCVCVSVPAVTAQRLQCDENKQLL